MHDKIQADVWTNHYRLLGEMEVALYDGDRARFSQAHESLNQSWEWIGSICSPPTVIPNQRICLTPTSSDSSSPHQTSPE